MGHHQRLRVDSWQRKSEDNIGLGGKKIVKNVDWKQQQQFCFGSF